MQTKLLTAIALICLSISALAQQRYSLYSATEGVKVEISGKTQAAKKGMDLKATDILLIPEGGAAEVLNTLDKRIYKSVRPGRVTVTTLLIEARQSATDKIANVSSKLNIGKSGSNFGKKVYNERGMVRRTQLECDSLAPDSLLPDSLVLTPDSLKVCTDSICR